MREFKDAMDKFLVTLCLLVADKASSINAPTKKETQNIQMINHFNNL